MIEKDGAGCGFDQSCDQLNEGGLSRAASADNRNGFPGRYFQVDAFENGWRFRTAIAKTDIAQLDVPIQDRNRLQPAAVASLFGFLLENVVEPVEQYDHDLEFVP